MKWQHVRILYQREVRSALRDRTIVVNSILIPILLYPLLLWVMFTGITFVRGQAERFESRVVLIDLPQAHVAMRDTLEQIEHVRLLDHVMPEEDALAAVLDGDIDVVLVFAPPEEEATALVDNFGVRLTYNASRERSDVAHNRMVAALDRYRVAWLKREAHQLGITSSEWQLFEIETRNTASSKQMGAFILGMMLPMFFMIMVAIGCYNPAVDATAGERERSTWETLMSVAASRMSIVVSKYLYVTTFGCMAGLLNLAAMSISMRAILAPLLRRSGEDFVISMPLAGLPIMALGAVLLAGFISAGMMLFASFARTFKEGQSMITPFYMLTILPVTILGQPDLEFSAFLAVIPVVNVAMMVRQAIMGSCPWDKILITVGMSGVCITACMVAASFILRFEDVVIGSFHGSFVAFLKERVFKSRSARHRLEGMR